MDTFPLVIPQGRQHRPDQVRQSGKSVDFTKERPVLVGGIAAGIVLGALGVMLLLRYRERNRPWYARAYDRACDAI